MADGRKKSQSLKPVRGGSKTTKTDSGKAKSSKVLKNAKARNGAKKGSASGKAAADKTTSKKIVYAAVVTAVALYFVSTVVSQQISLSKQNKQIEELENKISEAQKESKDLKNQVDNLNNPEYIEKVARERLGLIRPNERIFVDSNKSENNK